MGLVRPSSLDKAGASSLANRALSLAVDFDFDVAMIFCFYLLPRFRSDYRFVGCSIWLGKPRHVIVWLLILVTYPGYLSWLLILVTYPGYLSNVASQRRQILTRLSPSILCPMRVGPQLGQTTITLEMAMRDSCSAIPPFTFLRWSGRTFFFTIFTCSTSSFLSPGNTRNTRPCLPSSCPLMTFTWSLRLTSTFVCIVTLLPSRSLKSQGCHQS